MMNKYVTLTYLNDEKQILAWLVWEGQTLMDTFFQKKNNLFEVGNVYIGKVKHRMPSLHGVFVEISPQIQGYLSVKDHLDLPKQEEEILVQIKKQAHHHKNIALTNEITIAGTYCVLTSQTQFLRYSKKIPKSYKKILSNLYEEIKKEENLGIIFRSAAYQASLEDIQKEISALIIQLKTIISSAQYRTCYSLIYEENTFLESVKSQDIPVLTNDLSLFDFLCKKQVNAKFYDYNGKDIPLEAIYPIKTQLERLQSKKIWLKSGAYLVIESTEAFISIDINTGKNTPKKKKNNYFYEVNEEAITEAFRQIKLRNLSGVILIDLIDMKEKEHQEKILMLANELASLDPMGIEIIEVSKLQFMTLTRKRRRPSLAELSFSKF